MNTVRDIAEVPALPPSLDGWTRFLKTKRTINDLVEDVHRALIEDAEKGPDYLKYLHAVYNSQAVEGSMDADDLEAAGLIREKARSLDNNELANEKKQTIVNAMKVVLRRYHASREERRRGFEGDTVTNANGRGQE